MTTPALCSACRHPSLSTSFHLRGDHETGAGSKGGGCVAFHASGADVVRGDNYTLNVSCSRARPRRLRAISTYFGSSSQPKKRHPCRNAATPVVPDPTKGS